MNKVIIKYIIIFIIIFLLLDDIDFKSNINFHKYFNPQLYQDNVLYYDNTFPKEYHNNAKIGKNIAKTKKIVLCGLARNIEDNVNNVLKKLEFIGSNFLDYRIVIFENDSSDNTRYLIKENIKRNNKIILLDCSKYNSYDCKLNNQNNYTKGWNSVYRFNKMAFYREEYLNYIKENLYDYDYVLVKDLDIDGNMCIDGLFTSLLIKDFGAIYGNGHNVSFYGLIKIPLDSLAYVDINDNYPNNIDYFSIYQLLKNIIKLSYNTNLLKGFVPVKSGFNLYSLYNLKVFIKSSYIDLPICEHINLAKCIDNLGYKQFINTSWYGYTKRQGSGSIREIIFKMKNI